MPRTHCGTPPPRDVSCVSEALPYVWELKRLHQLGRGSYGQASVVEVVSPLPPWFPEEVLRATPKRNGRHQLVIKEIDLGNCPRDDRDALFSEISILKSVSHPNVVRYIDSSLDADTNKLLILMEYCDGGDVSGLIDAANRRRPVKGLSEPEVWALLIQLLMALKCLHFDHRVIHRDLKPQNIFLTSTGVVKVGDFGVSAVLAQNAEFARTFCGSPYYLAPEVCEEKPYNGKADLWSLGCVLYEVMAYGERAFKGDILPVLLTNICTAAYTPIDEVVECVAPGDVQRANATRTSFGPEIRRIVGLLLQRDPDHRASIIRLLRLPAIHARGPCLLHPELLRTPAYADVFRNQHALRTPGMETPLAFGGAGTWSEAVVSCNASPNFKVAGPRTGRTPSTVANRTAPTPANRHTKMRLVAQNKHTKVAGSAGLGVAPASGAGTPAAPSLHRDVPDDHLRMPQPSAIVFPEASPMIPVYGIDAPSCAASPSGVDRHNMPAAASSLTQYRPVDTQIQDCDATYSEDSEGPTPLKPAHGLVNDIGQRVARDGYDGADPPDTDTDDDLYPNQHDDVEGLTEEEATAIDKRVYSNWKVAAVPRDSFRFEGAEVDRLIHGHSNSAADVAVAVA
jgi:serine/threonine protein kinase